jgi:amino acid transporter
MPIELNLGFVIGAVLLFTGAIMAWVMLAYSGGMAFGFRGLTNLAAFLKDPKRRVARVIFICSLLVTVLGGLLTCGSVMAGDASRNRECARACRDTGWEGGRYRGNPHVRPSKGRGAYDCWCQRDSEWSPDPVNR